MDDDCRSMMIDETSWYTILRIADIFATKSSSGFNNTSFFFHVKSGFSPFAVILFLCCRFRLSLALHGAGSGEEGKRRFGQFSDESPHTQHTSIYYGTPQTKYISYTLR